MVRRIPAIWSSPNDLQAAMDAPAREAHGSPNRGGRSPGSGAVIIVDSTGMYPERWQCEIGETMDYDRLS